MKSCMRRVCFLIATAAALAFPSFALAGHGHHHGGNVPPGNSGIGQYQETVPGAGGNHPTSHGGGGGSGNGGGGGAQPAISPATAQALAAQGSAGQATANLANATAPQNGAGARGSGANGQPGG